MQKEKAKNISVLAHSLYMMCALTKNQMQQITSFWKTMITFNTPEAEETAKKIHVSYSSCLREAKRRSEETQARHMEMFRNCLYFSLALDTAQVGVDHFLSCVARFGFEDRIQQEVLFFEKVSEQQATDRQDLFLGGSMRNDGISQSSSPSRRTGRRTW